MERKKLIMNMRKEDYEALEETKDMLGFFSTTETLRFLINKGVKEVRRETK